MDLDLGTDGAGGVLVIGASDLRLLYDDGGTYPIAWLSASVAALVTVYYELRSDLLRPQGLDRDALTELDGMLALARTGAGDLRDRAERAGAGGATGGGVGRWSGGGEEGRGGGRGADTRDRLGRV